jgi:dynein heavy chain
MVHCRHGLMLVGPPLAAKTTTYQVLAAAICRLAEAGGEDAEVPVETHILNPKSLALPELYGSFDAVSHEFSDGVLGRIFRSCASGSRAAGRQWIALDGPVDAEWVENMNTVLDDNKKLCLLNGEVIQMNDGMRLIFETDGLSQASPATVSRCGMVYMEPAMLGAKSHLASWQARLEPRLLGPDGEAVDPSIVQRPSDLFESLFSQCADFVLNSCTLLVPCSEVQLARGLMGILEAQLLAPDFSALLRDPHSRPSDILPRVDMYFLYALVWSVGAITDEAGRQAFSVHLRKVTQGVQRLPEGRTVKFERGSLIPDGGQNVDEYFVDRARWASWKDKLRSALPARDLGDGSAGPSSLAIVPTSESLKIARLLELCVGNRLPVLLVGPTGTGKSVSVQQFLRATPRSKRSCISITFSAKSTTRQTGEILLAQLEKRGRRVLGPAAGKRCAVFVDDLSMPSLEQYGAQPPIELLR